MKNSEADWTYWFNLVYASNILTDISYYFSFCAKHFRSLLIRFNHSNISLLLFVTKKIIIYWSMSITHFQLHQPIFHFVMWSLFYSALCEHFSPKIAFSFFSQVANIELNFVNYNGRVLRNIIKVFYSLKLIYYLY